RGQAAMDHIRAVTSEIDTAAKDLLAQEIAARQASADVLALTTVIGSASLFLILVFSIVTIQRATNRRKQLIENLQHTEKQSKKARDLMHQAFGELLERAPDAILELDEGGRIVVVNGMVEQVFGYTRSELLGQNIEILVPETLRDAHRHH